MKLGTELILLAVLAGLPAHAQEVTPYQPTISVQTGIGMNLFLPYAEAKLGYRIPAGEHRWEPFVAFAPYGAGMGAVPGVALTGTRYYVTNTGPFQIFGSASVGALWNWSSNLNGVSSPASFSSAVILAGAGIDIMPWDHIGLSGQINVGYPFIVRPDLSLRVVF